MTLDDVRRILTEAAGADESILPGRDIADVPFTELGYDSLALLETAARINQEFGVALPDDTVVALSTPRELVEAVELASVPAQR
ncbi:acyl carrier protein [Dactylosporangium vinaceum]|uniref:Acyl carrier protein n=1 Tax=Dactylosporangium vinaceum TaxID=53362 RepID=A0ABV5M369_9ACTN|nr:acyl carrier protein [Dactylosporangium vinaceum]UAB99758.1 acyl carrier protein [Dactylosporangium vinaceum]